MGTARKRPESAMERGRRIARQRARRAVPEPAEIPPAPVSPAPRRESTKGVGDKPPKPRRLLDGRTTARLRAAVLYRYGSTCWICRKEIDLTLPGTHRRGFTIDHVLPFALRPELELHLPNLRPAHRYCNSQRGMKAIEELTHVHPIKKSFEL